jgi:hypothetical protein
MSGCDWMVAICHRIILMAGSWKSYGFIDGSSTLADGHRRLCTEKVWNAVVGVIWNAIAKVTGLVLPTPSLAH